MRPTNPEPGTATAARNPKPGSRQIRRKNTRTDIGQKRKNIPCPTRQKPHHKNAKHQPNTYRTLIKTRNRQKTTAQKPNTSHNAFRRKVNRTKTELDKSQKDGQAGSQKPHHKVAKSAKKCFPLPCANHTTKKPKVKSGAIRNPEPGRQAETRVGQKPKAAKKAETGPKWHFQKPRPNTQKKAKKRTSHIIEAKQGSTQSPAEFSTFPHPKPKKSKKNPKKV